MKIRLGDLRSLIREGLAGSQPEERYDMELLDDPKWSEDSVYVPRDIKKKIKKWMKDMKMSS
jgi:hypothetical protein